MSRRKRGWLSSTMRARCGAKNCCSIQLDYLLRRLAEQAEHDPALHEQQPWKAAWEKDYHWLGQVVTKHYQGDDSDLQMLLCSMLTLVAWSRPFCPT